MKRNCSCQGTNENCYRCFGSGYYDDAPTEPLPAELHGGAGHGLRQPKASGPPKQRKTKKRKRPNVGAAGTGERRTARSVVSKALNNCRLYVGNLSFDTTYESLCALMASLGDVHEVVMPRDRITGQGRGFAFVTMGSAELAAKAMSWLDGSVIDGRRLRVDVARDRPSTPTQGRNGERLGQPEPRSSEGGRTKKKKAKQKRKSLAAARMGTSSQLPHVPSEKGSGTDASQETGLGDDLRDAKRYWGHAFRDRKGDFGSYPVHDNFDDDSDPK